MNISNIPGAISQTGVSSSDLSVQPPVDASGSSGLQSMLTGAFQQCGVDRETLDTYLESAGVLKDTGMALKDAGMGLWGIKSAVSSFSSWMSSDSYINSKALMTLSHGLNGVVLLAKAQGGVFSTLGAYSGAASAFLNATKVYTGLQEGNVSQALFSGAKLCAAMALSGVPAAGAALSAAEFAYNNYYR
ncbi:hypothetical protein ABRZ04_05825 [Castellaniella ginsengisoli]|uniref:Uncharacterized protein n=1 Tax=Castellaniella ginsengisoli TaxID=546114 RepID=A0AB39D3E1_9BURK